MPTVYAALDDHVLVAEGDPDADNWTATESISDHSFRSLDAAPAPPDRAFAGTFESGLHRTRDGERVPMPERATVAGECLEQHNQRLDWW
jgi:hypothetical protein